jgi:hypothetical protein
VVLPNHLPGQPDRLAESRDAADLLAALECLLADRSALIAWLRALIEDPEQLAGVVAGSYWHANGFAKLILHSTADFRIRLHVWPAGEGRRGEPDPHSHRWDFASTVLVGDGLAIVESTELPEPNSDRGSTCTRYLYDGFELVDAGVAALAEDRRFQVLTGDRYITMTTTIHTVLPLGNDLVTTLLVQGPHLSSATAVYGTDLAPLVNRAGRRVDADDVAALISDVVATLEPGA